MPSASSVPAATPATHEESRSWRGALELAALTLLVMILSVLAIMPRVFFWKDYPEMSFETARVPALVAQLQDPVGWDRAYLNNPFFGDNALRWRLLPPALGHALHVPPRIYLGLPWLGLFLLVGTSLHYLRQMGVSRWALLGAGVLLGTSAVFFGSSTSLGYFDCLYLLALVIFTFSPSPLLAVAACFLGPWCDEKFLLMLPACACLRWARQPSWRWVAGATLGVLVYSCIRLSALAGGDSSFRLQVAMVKATFSLYCGGLPAGWWYGFRTGWVLIGLGVFLTWRQLPRIAGLLLLVGLLAAIAAISLLAWDTTRSIAMLFPFFLAGASDARLRPALLWLAIINVLLPAAYVCCAIPVTVPLTSFLHLWSHRQLW